MIVEAFYAATLSDLADEIAANGTAKPDPIAADSWVARSILQKAIRRGMTDLALRAAAQLLLIDRRTLWRRLLVTALEDLGTGEFTTTVRVTAASRDSAWRASTGGDWAVIAALVQGACEGTRCQAANDLWTIAMHDPRLSTFKADLCEASIHDVVAIAVDQDYELGQRAVATLLALGADVGTDAPAHIAPDPMGLFSAFAAVGDTPVIAAVYADTFRRTQVALGGLALCLPDPGDKLQSIAKTSDEIPLVAWIDETPNFALDQYTRHGKAAIRAYVAASVRWTRFTSGLGLSPTDSRNAAGELLFRIEGAAVTNRRSWDLGKRLHQCAAQIGCFLPPVTVDEGKAILRAELPLVDEMRRRIIHTL